jgi:hypothetical protein
MQRRTTRFPGQEVHKVGKLFITPIYSLENSTPGPGLWLGMFRLGMRGVWQMLLPDRKTGFKRYGMISRAVY